MKTRSVVISVSLPVTVCAGQDVDLPAGQYVAADLTRYVDLHQTTTGVIVDVGPPYNTGRMARVTVQETIPAWAHGGSGHLARLRVAAPPEATIVRGWFYAGGLPSYGFGLVWDDGTQQFLGRTVADALARLKHVNP
jgi:hypothetical protein